MLKLVVREEQIHVQITPY